MPERSWRHASRTCQDHKRWQADVESEPLAVLPGVRDDAAGLDFRFFSK